MTRTLVQYGKNAQQWCTALPEVFGASNYENDEIFYTTLGKITVMGSSSRKRDKLSDIMSASADEILAQDVAMVAAERKKVKADDIFVDRRKELVDRREIAGGIGYFNCRRQLKDRRRNKYVYDVREWWLRVNYVETDQ